MTTEDMEDIATSLLMRRNFIETGTVTLSANDAIERAQHRLVRALDPAQKETITRLERLAEKFRLAAGQKSMEPGGDRVTEALKKMEKWRLSDAEEEDLLR